MIFFLFPPNQLHQRLVLSLLVLFFDGSFEGNFALNDQKQSFRLGVVPVDIVSFAELEGLEESEVVLVQTLH